MKDSSNTGSALKPSLGRGASVPGLLKTWAVPELLNPLGDSNDLSTQPSSRLGHGVSVERTG